MWVDPFFQTWWQTKPSYDAMPTAYDGGLPGTYTDNPHRNLMPRDVLRV